MRISDVRTYVVPGGPHRNYLLVKLLTDEGVYGWGEGTLEGQEEAVARAVHTMVDRIRGQDATRIEFLWQVLYRHGFWRGGVVLNTALSAVDQALWDIQGKALGVPVYRLLGGPVRDRVRAYAHAGTPEQARQVVDMGFTAFKTGGWYANEAIDEARIPAELARRMEALRRAVGDDVDIMIDNHGRSRPSLAVRQIRAVEEFNILFFEEPVPPDNLDALAEVRRHEFRCDLATGERLFTRWGFRDLIERRLADVIQPDLSHAGGISEVRRISAMAETYYILVAPHNPNGPVCTAASVHLDLAIPNFLIQEHAPFPQEVSEAMTRRLTLKDGHFLPPEAPGLGVDFDESALERLQSGAGRRTYMGAFYRDGAPADV